MPKISIIVPVYNVSTYLSECLESLTNQTLKEIEIILINDGSTDGSDKICNKYAELDERIRVFHKKNEGVSAARNLGIKESRGKWLTFVDGDDWIEKNTCEFVYNKGIKYDADIIIWSYFKSYADEEKELELLPGGDKINFSDKDKEFLQLKSIYSNYGNMKLSDTVSAGTVWCKLYKREFIKDNELKFKIGLTRAQDTEFAINAFEYSNRIVYFNKSLYHYRISNTSVCSGTKYIPDTETPFNMLLDEFNKFIKRYKKGEEFYKALYARTIQVLLWHLKHNYFHKGNQDNLIIKRRRMKELIESEPYSTAIRNVDYDMLSKKERLLVQLYKRNLILSFYFIYELYSIYEKKKSVRFD